MKKTLLFAVSVLIFNTTYGQVSLPVLKHQESLPATGFVENKGQIKDQYGLPSPDARYIFTGHNFNLILKDNGFSYELVQHNSKPMISEANCAISFPPNADEDEVIVVEKEVT